MLTPRTTIVYDAEKTKTIPARMRDEMVSTKTAERRLRLRSSYVILAEEQQASPVIAAKFMVNLLRKSTAVSKAFTQHRNTRFTIPGVSSCLALSTAERTIRTTQTSNPDKHIVPEEGPKTFLQAKFPQLMSI